MTQRILNMLKICSLLELRMPGFCKQVFLKRISHVKQSLCFTSHIVVFLRHTLQFIVIPNTILSFNHYESLEKTVFSMHEGGKIQQ